MEIVKALIDFAVRLEEEHLSAVASAVDSLAESIVKTAQYVGPQGYWVRNERCWANCYRQKRASFPNKAAQEVWFDCQEEFEESINNDGSAWDKYAESDSTIKTASFRNLNIKLAESLTNNKDIVEAIESAQQEAAWKLSEETKKGATALSRIAEDLSDFDADLAKEARNLAETLKKEAAPWQGQWGNNPNTGWGQGIKNVFKNIPGVPKKLDLSSLEQQLSQVDALGRARQVDPNTKKYRNDPAYEKAVQRLNALINQNSSLVPAGSPIKAALDSVKTAPAGQRLQTIQNALQVVRNQQAGVKPPVAPAVGGPPEAPAAVGGPPEAPAAVGGPPEAPAAVGGPPQSSNTLYDDEQKVPGLSQPMGKFTNQQLDSLIQTLTQEKRRRKGSVETSYMAPGLNLGGENTPVASANTPSAPAQQYTQQYAPGVGDYQRGKGFEVPKAANSYKKVLFKI